MFKQHIASRNQLRVIRANRGRGWAELLLSSNRYVLSLAILFAIVVPELFHPFVSEWGYWFTIGATGFETSMGGAVVAIIAAHMSLRHMGLLPLVAAKSLILPTIIASFSAAIIVLKMFGLQLPPYHLWSAFLITLIWYYVVSLLRVRMLRPVMGMIGVPDEFVGDLPRHITWEVIAQPLLRRPYAAVVVDPHASFDIEWSHFITSLVLDGIPVYHRSHIQEGLTGRVVFHSPADNDFGALLPSFTYLRVKRVIDLAMLVPALMLALPILLVAVVAIKLDSPGPVLFKQLRTGYRGQHFWCFKLRTMQHNAPGPDFTRERDARITRVGAYLRKWRIDELPQMINILRGEMSWIGPRPEAVALAEAYAAQVPFYDYRHAVRPGITGWAAVNQGNVAEADEARKKLEFDFYYIKYFSIWLDFVIVLKTIRTVATGFGSR